MGDDARRILVTNDDGVASDGLWHLAAALRADGHSVTVAAPARDSSGFGSAVGHIGPGAVIDVEPVAWPSAWAADGAEAWAVDGPPGRCVLAAVLGVFGAPPDLVVSGINAGANTGRFLNLHSGTLGAALTAGNSGIRALAVSLDVTPGTTHAGTRWDTAARVAASLVGQLWTRPAHTVWNVNVPDVAATDLAGIAEAHLGRSRNALSATPAGNGRHEMRFVPTDSRPTRTDRPTRPDRDLLDDGWVTITSVAPPALHPVGDVRLEMTPPGS